WEAMPLSGRTTSRRARWHAEPKRCTNAPWRRARGCEIASDFRPMNARLRHLLATFSRARVLVVGDLMLDRFIWGDVRRISPEAPVPVVHVARESEHAGGAGNVVANLAALGAHPAVVGWIGRDQPGRTLRRLLHELGADTAGSVAGQHIPQLAEC